MELYIHIPFCIKKCNYCDFLSMPSDEETRAHYVKALLQEIRYYGAVIRETVSTVYFGGGTPSVLSAEALVEILNAVRAHFTLEKDCEITVEVNPATIDLTGLRTLKEGGVNRLSIGVQSADDAELCLLGRIHTFKDAQKTVENARKVEINNLNLDLISSLPGQTLEKYEQNLKEILALKPEHISSYALILEEGTPFYEYYVNHKGLLPSEEADRKMYYLTREMLQKEGYLRYEISNYAKPGYESKHNSGYWRRIPYLGLGLGAASMLQHTRWKNTTGLKEYLQIFGDNGSGLNPAAEWENEQLRSSFEEWISLTKQDEMAEYFFLGLRMSEGVSIQGFGKEFGEDLDKVYGAQIEKLIKEGLLVREDAKDRIYLTDFGMDVSNYVFEAFIL